MFSAKWEKHVASAHRVLVDTLVSQKCKPRWSEWGSGIYHIISSTSEYAQPQTEVSSTTCV